MTVDEFKAQSFLCRHCGADVIILERVINNNGVRPICVACGSKTPIEGVTFLKQNSDRRLNRPSSDPTTSEVWDANGNTCAFCGLTKAECDLLGIGITKQHVVPYCAGGPDSPLIPFCARCQQASLAALEVTLKMRRYIEKTSPKSIGSDE